MVKKTTQKKVVTVVKEEKPDLISSTEEQKRLENMSKAYKVSMHQISEIYAKCYEDLKTKGIAEADLEHFAVNAVMNELRKQVRREEFVPKAKAVAITGFIIGDSGIWDKADTIRNEAKRYVEKYGLEAARDAGYITGDNQVIDRREKIYGRENPNVGKPLDEKLKLRSRTLHLIAKKNGDKVYKYSTLQTNDNTLALGWNKILFERMAQTFGILKEDTKTEMMFNSSQAEDTQTIFKAINDETDVAKLYMEIVSPMLTKIDNVEKQHELTKDAWDRHIFVRGIVTWIGRDRPSPWGSIMMGLMDSESGAEVRISVPAHLAINFGELSEIIVLGKTRRTKQKNQDTGKQEDADVAIDALGMHILKATPATVSRPETLDEEVQINGWLE
jgi:hypothetical protein